MRIAKRLEETEAAAVGKAQTVVGRRLEYKFSTAAGTEWFAGSVQAKSKAEPWLTVAFDDGEIMCVIRGATLAQGKQELSNMHKMHQLRPANSTVSTPRFMQHSWIDSVLLALWRREAREATVCLQNVRRSSS